MARDQTEEQASAQTSRRRELLGGHGQSTLGVSVTHVETGDRGLATTRWNDWLASVVLTRQTSEPWCPWLDDLPGFRQRNAVCHPAGRATAGCVVPCFISWTGKWGCLSRSYRCLSTLKATGSAIASSAGVSLPPVFWKGIAWSQFANTGLPDQHTVFWKGYEKSIS